MLPCLQHKSANDVIEKQNRSLTSNLKSTKIDNNKHKPNTNGENV
jgi:hypothetical protein